ncbi:hypothetical protein J3459_013523 [Metarhizium acridum]|nr:hypothetical protein J3459_013523 [Metarhizium acridum]KAG8421788.1 hypothetical protein J3458_003631 [Metarhizium acridum]
MRIYDQSVEDECDESILLNIFWPQNDMPDASCGDVIIVFSARVQRYEASISLCTHKTTDLHIYESIKIPKSRADASKARRPSNRTKINRQPNKIENEFVSVLYNTINKEKVPSQSKFDDMKRISINLNKKFSELKDLQEKSFVDTVVQIVREPYDLGDKFTLWVSDYTENQLFYHYKFMEGGFFEGRDDWPNDCINKSSGSSQKSEWIGPFGKMSMQITCFGSHARAIRDQHISIGTWVSLRNLQIKLGHNAANLEGYLRDERGFKGNKINISKLDHLDSDTLSPELKNALRRKRDYEKRKKEALKDLSEAANAGLKRKAQLGLSSEKPRRNSKQKRAENRQSKQLGYNQQNGQADDALPPDNIHVPEDLNRQIKCENERKAVTSIADILAPTYYETTIQGDTIKLQLPFINSNYRTYARVTDFMPPCLEDFAHRKRRTSEYAGLSDNEESDPESASDSDNDAHPLSALTNVVTGWEWRFWLKLEDAQCKESSKGSKDSKDSKDSIWVVVNNQSAQMLLGLDASDLRNDEKSLGDLRQRLWLLWGNLEEQKAEMENRVLKARRSSNSSAPPAHSDDEESGTKKPARIEVSNRAFGCCIHQYGVTVAEDDETKADAGNGKRWERIFGLFGTRITGFRH